MIPNQAARRQKRKALKMQFKMNPTSFTKTESQLELEYIEGIKQAS